MSKHTTYIWFLLALCIFSCKPDDDDPKVDNSFDLEYPVYYSDPEIPSDNPMNTKVVELGRELFYEEMLSLDSSLSCASCHKQSEGFADGLALGKGFQDVELSRGSMAIVNLAWNDDFFWDGRSPSLEDQALKPIENPLEMNLSVTDAVSRLSDSDKYKALFQEAFGSEEVTSNRLAKAIAQFERTLISKDSKFDKYLRGEASFTNDELEGRNLFFTHPEPFEGLRGGNCGDCHGGALTMLNKFSNNGLDSVFTDLGLYDVTGNSEDSAKFKVVSLRNIAVTGPYMHDGRFETLEEVLDHYNEHITESSTLDPLITSATNVQFSGSLSLTEAEKEKIIIFLNTLTDSTFLQNPDFSDPEQQ